MELNFFSNKNRVVNLIIQDHSIRFMELKNAHSPVPYRWGERYLPHGIINNGIIQDMVELQHILEQCVDEWRIQKRQVRFLVPDSFVIIRKVSIPYEIKENEIDGYLYLELGSSIHLPFNDPVFDTVFLETKNNKREVLIFAAEEDKVRAYTSLLSECKLEPVSAEISALALYRLYHHLGHAKQNDHLLIAQFDLHKVNISVFSGPIPLIMHHIPVDIHMNNWDLKLNESGLPEWNFIGDPVKEIDFQYRDTYKEISRLADFYRYTLTKGENQVTKILVHGDHPLFSFILDEMKSRFDIPIVTINEKELPIENNNHLPRNYHLVMGLALKEV